MSKRLISLVILLALLLCGCAEGSVTAPELVDSVKVVYDTVAVERGEVVAAVLYDTYVMPVSIDTKFDEISGTVEEIFVKPGNVVAEGDALLRLDTEVLEERLVSAKENLDALESTGERERRLLEIDLEFARLSYEEQLELDPNGVNTELAELEVRKCESAIADYDDSFSRSLTAAHEQVTSLEDEIAASTLRAPADGEVVTVHVAVGARVSNETTLVTITNGAERYIHCDGAEKIPSSGDAYMVLNGVEYALERWEYTDSETSAFEAAGVSAPHRFLRADGGELPAIGEYIQVTLVREEAADTLRIPANALWRDAGVTYVYVVDGNEKIYTEVEVGITNDAFVEILGGLREGDAVYVGN